MMWIQNKKKKCEMENTCVCVAGSVRTLNCRRVEFVVGCWRIHYIWRYHFQDKRLQFRRRNRFHSMKLMDKLIRRTAPMLRHMYIILCDWKWFSMVNPIFWVAVLSTILHSTRHHWIVIAEQCKFTWPCKCVRAMQRTKFWIGIVSFLSVFICGMYSA